MQVVDFAVRTGAVVLTFVLPEVSYGHEAPASALHRDLGLRLLLRRGAAECPAPRSSTNALPSDQPRHAPRGGLTLTVEELAGAGEPVRTGLLSLAERLEQLVADSGEVDSLAEHYITENIVPRYAAADARHAALAAVTGTEVLVTLNLKHLANELAERRLNAVNVREGYPQVRIKTPEEVVRYEA
jgi:hypothetical protein